MSRGAALTTGCMSGFLLSSRRSGLACSLRLASASRVSKWRSKYAINVAASYDFGTQLALSNSVTVFRTGTDLTVGLGFSYNALVNNFGVNFVVIPNLAAAAGFGRAGSPLVAQR